MHDDDDSPSIVLENGTLNTKVGVAGEDSPKLNFPTCVGYPPEMAHLSIKAGETWKGQYTVGDEAERKKSSSLLKWPIEGGIVKDWDAMEKVWTHAFSELMVTPAEEYGGVLLTDAITNPKDGREQMTHIMFERFQLPNFYVAAQPMLAMYGAGRTTGVTVDAGHDYIHCVPLLDGYPLPYASQKYPIAGKALTAALMESVQQQLATSPDISSAMKMKEQCCRVAVDYAADAQKATDSPKEFMMPDGAKVTLGVEQVAPCELLFTPEKHGRDHRGLQYVVNKVIMDCDYEQRDELWKNVLLAGGTSFTKNLPERLQSELGALAPSSAKVSVTAMAERKVCSWVGGSILVSLNTFNQMWITKDEYDESGPSIVHRKCI